MRFCQGQRKKTISSAPKQAHCASYLLMNNVIGYFVKSIDMPLRYLALLGSFKINMHTSFFT
jgi:hypothetical protein